MLFSFSLLIVLLNSRPMDTHPVATPKQAKVHTFNTHTLPVANPKNTKHQTVDTLTEANPMLTAGYFQGDMLLTEAQKNLFTKNTTKMQRNMVENLWPNNRVTVLFTGTYQQHQIDLIFEAMSHISSETCVSFQYATTYSEPYLLIQTTELGCWAEVGYLDRPQRLNLGPNCFQKGIIVHELLHTLGFYHQHSASDRDEYVRIHLENVKVNEEHNFNKYPPDVVNDYGVGYDYASVMHYSATDFSSNNKPTIEVLEKPAPSIGQRSELSAKDIMKLNRAYKCYPVIEEEEKGVDEKIQEKKKQKEVEIQKPKEEYEYSKEEKEKNRLGAKYFLEIILPRIVKNFLADIEA